MTDVATLPFEGVTECGYCGRRLVLWAADDWRCPHCAPQLARIRTTDEWADWMRRVRRERRASLCPDCGHAGRHPTVAVSRFRPDGPLGYRAEGGPVRATRAEAEADCCRMRRTS